MTTTLPNGTRVPDVASTSWAGDLEVNWQLLDAAIGAIGSNVQTNRPNTWTAEQTFSEPIIGNLTGTASKAGADEDGTSIKTGYVNVAGNQTVTGQKTWSGNQLFPSPVYHKNNTYEIGNIPASNIVTNIYLADKNNVYTSFVRSVIYASGRTATEIRAKNAFKNGVLDPTGADISSNLNVEVQPNGTKTIYWDGLIRNDVTPFTTNNNSLGSSTNQWSSVYAQSYYYNGTQWGLNQDNTWIGGNAFLAGSYNNHTVLANATLDLSNGNPALSETNQGMILFTDKNKWLGKTYARLQSWTATDQTVTVLGATYRPDANTKNDFSVWLSNTSNLKSFHPYGVSEPHLGNAAHKWKTLNGINPGALSFPDMVNFIDVSGSIVPPSGESTINYSGGQNTFMSSVDGWLSIRLDGASFLQIYRNAYNCPGTTVSEPSGTRKLVTTLPVKAGVTYIIVMNGNPTETRFHLYPCFGNV